MNYLLLFYFVNFNNCIVLFVAVCNCAKQRPAITLPVFEMCILQTQQLLSYKKLTSVRNMIFIQSLIKTKANVVWRSIGLLALLSALPHLAQAQASRQFVNPSFEVPTRTTCGGGLDVILVPQTIVPGWKTTSAGTFSSFNCPLLSWDGPTATNIIEIWPTGYSGQTAPNGTKFAELNAYEPSRLYQEICVLNGDTINYTFNHKSRDGGTETIQFGLNAAGSTVKAVTTVMGTASSSNNLVWNTNTGSYVSTLPSGMYQLGFESVAPGGSHGNFLDNLQFVANPIVSLATSSITRAEGTSTPSGATTTAGAFGVAFSGTLTAPLIVHLEVIGGTAAPSDYSLPNGTAADFTLSIPAGIYPAGTIFQIPITALTDYITESTETIIFQIKQNANYSIGDGINCTAPAITQATLNITNVTPPSANITVRKVTIGGVGGPFTFTATNTVAGTFTGATTATAGTAVSAGTVTYAPLTATTITEAAFTGFTLTSASCTGLGSGGTQTTTINTGGAGGFIALNAAATASGANIVCTFTNAANTAAITITKTDGKSTTSSGSLNSYTITVSNAGPANAAGSVLTDTPSAGLTCPGTLGAATVSCTATNGAQCPGAATINTPSTVTYAELTVGAVIPQLPATGSLSFIYQCTVN